MYQSNWSFNNPGHLNFWKIFVQMTNPRAKKLFKCLIIGPFQVIKCPHPWENYQITVHELFSSFCVCKHGLIDNTKENQGTTWHEEQGGQVKGINISFCRPLLFNQSATNAESLPLNASKFVSAMIYQPTWKRNMKSRLASGYKWWSNAPPPGRLRWSNSIPPGQEKESNARFSVTKAVFFLSMNITCHLKLLTVGLNARSICLLTAAKTRTFKKVMFCTMFRFLICPLSWKDLFNKLVRSARLRLKDALDWLLIRDWKLGTSVVPTCVYTAKVISIKP